MSRRNPNELRGLPGGWRVIGSGKDYAMYQITLLSPDGWFWNYLKDGTWSTPPSRASGYRSMDLTRAPWLVDMVALESATTPEARIAAGAHPHDDRVGELQRATALQETQRARKEAQLAVKSGAEVFIDGAQDAWETSDDESRGGMPSHGTYGGSGWRVRVPATGWEVRHDRYEDIPSWARLAVKKNPSTNPVVREVMREGRKTYELPDGRWFLTRAKAESKMGA